MGSSSPQLARAIVLHPLADLSTAWPPFFVENLRQVFTQGMGKPGSNFKALRNQLVKSLPSAPPPGPATFIVRCLEALVVVTPPHDEGLSHLLLSAINLSDWSNCPPEDLSMARQTAAHLFLSCLNGRVQMESRVLVRLASVYGLVLKDIAGVLSTGQDDDEAARLKAAKELVECYILDLLKMRSYTGAVSLLQSFNLQTCDYQELVATMIDAGQASVALEWAACLGNEMLKFVVQHCTETGMFRVAYNVVRQYRLQEDFPDAYYLYRKSTLRKLVTKGSWDVAQSIVEGDPQLVDYLLTLALEENDAEIVSGICEHFGLDPVPIISEAGTGSEENHYLQLESLVPEKNVHWIDSDDGLAFAKRSLVGVNVIGIDCEWRADILKGVQQHKVSIMQVASSERVLVLDLISLSKHSQHSLNGFIACLFHATDILKLGYAVHQDLERLSGAFTEIEAFRVCDPVLDLQRVFGRPTKGGLSGLAKSVLGSYLNKRIRMSDWEARPLSQKQLHYAALDAAVLLPIYSSISQQPSSAMKEQLWKSHVTSFRVGPRLKDVVHKEGINRTTSLICSHENLVLATCDLLGLPIPGLMKAELLHFTNSAKLPAPVYESVPIGRSSESAFYGTVRVGGATYTGRLASTRKDAEFWAARVALRKLKKGLGNAGFENCLKMGHKKATRLRVLQACSNDSRTGCARLTREFIRGSQSVNSILKGVGGFSCLLRPLQH